MNLYTDLPVGLNVDRLVGVDVGLGGGIGRPTAASTSALSRLLI